MISADNSDLTEIRGRLAEIKERTRSVRSDPSQWPFREAAAVLSMFIPDRLRPFNSSQPSEPGWFDFIVDCEPAPARTGGAWWKLRDDVRRAALRRLASRDQMRMALTANLDRPSDVLQRVFEQVVSDQYDRIDPRRMSRDELSSLATIREWIGDILDGLPSDYNIKRALATTDMLEPMRRLAGGNQFIGRANELAELREYVGVNVSGNVTSVARRFVRETYYDFFQRPILVLTGLGGAGKSSLLARFILDHCEDFDSQEALPFIYLDFDRASIIPSKPISIIATAALQLAIEWPVFERQLIGIAEQIRPIIAGDEFSMESTKLLGSRTGVIDEFAGIINEGSSGRPILFVIDTFEEAQFLGLDVVQEVAAILSTIQSRAPMLRIVVAGRGDLQDQTSSFLPTRPIHVGDLELEEAHELVRRQLPRDFDDDGNIANEIIQLVGRNPMSLKLASLVVIDQGVDQLRTVETRNWLYLRVKSETVQARLYGRILAHLHDEDVQKLAKPGLVLRRLTADIIEKVLAVPCNLKLESPHRAEELLNLLADEVALVERAPDGSLRHRQDVRRVMLKDLVEDVPKLQIRAIHDAAVAYYASMSTGAVERAEEIYHRLMRGDDPSSLDVLWNKNIEPSLRTAIEEVPPPAQLWLSRKLGITPDARLLAQAQLEEWEAITALSARRLLQAGSAEAALRTIRRRSDRSPSSPLYRLEAEAFRLMGQTQQALGVIERGIDASASAGAIAAYREMLIEQALINETAGRLESALQAIRSAQKLAGAPLEGIDALRLSTTEVRLLRKLGSSEDNARQSAIERAKELITPKLLDELEGNPALLRETVAELGTVDSDLISRGLEIIGLEPMNSTQRAQFANALFKWNEHLATATNRQGELTSRAGLSIKADTKAWESFVSTGTTNDLSRQVLNWRAELQPDQNVDNAVVDVYRVGVDASLQLPTQIQSKTRSRIAKKSETRVTRKLK